MEHILNVPADNEKLKELRAGDSVLLSGTVYTARDAAHKRICEAMDRGEKLPFELSGSAVYYVGPTPSPESCCIGAAGPTTSGRMDAYSPRLLDAGLKIMIGKGGRSEAVKDAMRRNAGCICKAESLAVTHLCAGRYLNFAFELIVQLKRFFSVIHCFSFSHA